MVSNLSLSEKLQSRLSRSFHASRALRFVPKSLRFLFWNFRKRSSCFLLVRLPSISRKSLDSRSLDFYAMKFSWFLPFSGTVRFFSEHLLFYHLLSYLSATFLFFSVFLSSSSWPLSSDSLSILPNHPLSVNTFFETFLSFFLSLNSQSNFQKRKETGI